MPLHLHLKNATAPKDRREAMRRKAEELRAKKSGDFFNLPTGKTKIRLLPPIDDQHEWYFETAWHYGIGPERSAVICHETTFGEGHTCPVCEKMREFEASNDEKLKKTAKQMRPRSRIFCNVFVLESPNNIRGNKVLAFGPGVFGDLIGFFTDGDFNDLDDVEEGYNINIKKVTGEDWSDTSYETRVVPKVVPLSDVVDDVDEVLARRKDLEKTVEVLPVDEISELVEATDFDNYSTKPKKRGSGSSKSSD